MRWWKITTILAAMVLFVAACTDDEGTQTADDQTAVEGASTVPSEDEAEQATESTEGSDDYGDRGDAGDSASGAVTTAESDFGTILVNAEGFSLYVFTNDTEGVSNCSGDCLANWPAVPGDVGVGEGLDESLFSKIDRDDGSHQLTVKGQPLYTFAADAAPGDTNGQGVGDVWFLVSADGELISA